MQQQVPRCPSCQGVVKPDITFFGEKLPAKVKRAVEADHNKVTKMSLVCCMHIRPPDLSDLRALGC